MAQLMPIPNPEFTDANGDPLAGGQLFSYIAGTSTPLATYTDASGGTPNTNPVILGSNGEASVWLGASAYKFILKDSLGNTIWTVDNVSVIQPGSIDSTKLANGAVGSSQIANGAVGTSQLAASSVTGAKIASSTITNANMASLIEVVVKNVRDLSSPGLIQMIPQYEWSNPSLLSNPGTLPNAQANSAKWSPNGEFLAVSVASSVKLIIYQRVNNILTPLSISAQTATYMAWSPCGDFLAVGGSGKSFTVYQRTGNSFAAVTAVITGTVNGTSWNVNGIAWSPNSDFIMVSAFGTSSGHALCVLERNGTTFTDISTTSTITQGLGPEAWSPDSSMFLVCDSSTGLIDAYSRADNVFSSITAPVVTSYANDIVDMAFSPDGNFFAVAVNISPYVLIFQLSGSTFTQLPNPATLPAGAANCVAWSANSEYLVVGHASSPYMTIYSVSGTTFTKIANPTILPAAAVLSAHWSQTKQYLAVASGTTPYIQVYETASILAANGIFWTRAANV